MLAWIRRVLATAQWVALTDAPYRATRSALERGDHVDDATVRRTFGDWLDSREHLFRVLFGRRVTEWFERIEREAEEERRA